LGRRIGAPRQDMLSSAPPFPIAFTFASVHYLRYFLRRFAQRMKRLSRGGSNAMTEEKDDEATTTSLSVSRRLVVSFPGNATLRSRVVDEAEEIFLEGRSGVQTPQSSRGLSEGLPWWHLCAFALDLTSHSVEETDGVDEDGHNQHLVQRVRLKC